MIVSQQASKGGDMASAESRHPPGRALLQLRYELQRLHRQSGEPSFRVVAQRTAKAISHTTVGSVLRCESPPGWGPLELVVEALGGDHREFRTLWVAVRDEISPLELPKPTAWVESESYEPQPTGNLSIPDLEAAEQDLQERAAKRSHREGEARRELLVALEARADLSDRFGVLHEELGRERGRNEGLRERLAELEAERDASSRHIERLQDELRSVREERLVLLEKLNGLHSRRTELYFAWAREEERRRLGAESDQVRRLDEARELRQRLSAAEELLTSVLAQKGDFEPERDES
jgi:hypothetical protein